MDDVIKKIEGCFYCGKKNVGLYRCARCNIAHYCSKQCQRNHWKSDVFMSPAHKHTCKNPGILAGATAVARVAVKENRFRLVEAMIEIMPPSTLDDPLDSSGVNLLILAVQCGYINIVNILLDAGADPFLKDNDTLLQYTVVNNTLTTMDFLLSKVSPSSKFVNGRDSDGQTSLMVSVYLGLRQATRQLLGGGADVDLTDKFESTALMIAILEGHDDMALILMYEGGADIHYSDRSGRSALSIAIHKKNKKMTHVLIDAGASLDFALEGDSLKRLVQDHDGFKMLCNGNVTFNALYNICAKEEQRLIRKGYQSKQKNTKSKLAKLKKTLDSKNRLYDGLHTIHQETKEQLARALEAITDHRQKEKCEHTKHQETKEQLARALETHRQKEECEICMIHEKNCTLRCGHRFCETCIVNLKKCCFCQKEFTDWIKTYN